MWAHFQLAAVLSNIIYLLDMNEFTFKENQTQQIWYGTDSSEGVIYSPEFASSSNYTFSTSKVLNVTFCNLPNLHWLHLDYIEKLPPSGCFTKGNAPPYIILDGPGLLNKTESCSDSIYSWKTLQFNEPLVKLTLPLTSSPKSTFRIDYRGKWHIKLFVHHNICILFDFYLP